MPQILSANIPMHDVMNVIPAVTAGGFAAIVNPEYFFVGYGGPAFSVVLFSLWHSALWIYGCCILLGAVIGFGAAQWRAWHEGKGAKGPADDARVLSRELKEKKEALRLAERQLEENNAALIAMQDKLIESEKMGSLGKLTAGIAHEINNPLNFISGAAQALTVLIQHPGKPWQEMTEADFKAFNGELAEIARIINTGVERSVKIIKGLKTFSSPDWQGEVDSSADILETVQVALVLLASKRKEWDVDITLNIPPGTIARANATMLSQVFTNIVDNAIDAVAEVKGRRREIHIYSTHDGNNVEVAIRDNGGGVPQDIRSRIFDTFFTTKDAGKGTGLGLAISYNIVKRFGGAITCDSEEGKGTQFVVTLVSGK